MYVTCAPCGKQASEEYAAARRVCAGCGTPFPGYLPPTPVVPVREALPGDAEKPTEKLPAPDPVGHARRRGR